MEKLSPGIPHQGSSVKNFSQFGSDGKKTETNITYQELDLQARTIASYLQKQNLSGTRVLLIYPSSLEFISAFFGCLYAGVTAVPVHQPRPKQKLSNLANIINDCSPQAILSLDNSIDNLKSYLSDRLNFKHLQYIPTDRFTGGENRPTSFEATPQKLAFLQYTSGSTGKPKGVMITHSNLLHNCEIIKRNFGHNSNSRIVIWLPNYHDMGLIGGIISPIYTNSSCLLMSPIVFLRQPWQWLQAISDYKATTSGAPNFAYELCLRRITPEQKKNLDLSSWDLAFIGAETIRSETIKEFTTKFADCGFKEGAFYPCYGLAEATLMVTGGIKGHVPRVIQINTDELSKNEVGELTPKSLKGNNINGYNPPNDENNSKKIVSCGEINSGQEVVIVDPDTQKQCENDRVGEIWVSSESVAQGYWQKSELTKETFQANITDDRNRQFLRTADLGFIKDNHLYVTGRCKDVVIIRGRNYYPQDIELTAQQAHSALKVDAGATFSVEIDRQERLIIVQEVDRTHLRKLNIDEVKQGVKSAISQEYGLQLHELVLIKPTSIPKTSSGKIKRHLCKTKYLQNTLQVVANKQENNLPVSKNDKNKIHSLNSTTQNKQDNLPLNKGVNWTQCRMTASILKYCIFPRR